MTNTVNVAATMLPASVCAIVEQSCQRLNFTYHSFGSSAGLLASIDTDAPQILVLPLAYDAKRTLQIQEHFRNAMNPVCVVFLAAGASVTEAVQAMKRGAIDVLMIDAAPKAFEDALLRAHQTWQIRSDWITQRDHACRQLRSLSDRQLCILRHVAQGLTNRDIAAELQISPRTVEKHRQAIYERTATRHPAELTRMQVLATCRPDTIFTLSPENQNFSESSVRTRQMAVSAR